MTLPTHTIPLKMYNYGGPAVDEENHLCSFPNCGATAWDDGCPLTYVTVVTRVGEEGYGEITQALCNEHLITVTEYLMAIGFISHNHHGTQMFEDESCGNCGSTCPNPTEYGPELVQPNSS